MDPILNQTLSRLPILGEPHIMILTIRLNLGGLQILIFTMKLNLGGLQTLVPTLRLNLGDPIIMT